MQPASLARTLVLCALFVVIPASAQGLPRIVEFYFDQDNAAAPVELVPADAPDLVDQLMRQRERGRRGVEATLQLAAVAVAQSRPELARTLYGEALAAVSPGSVLARRAYWNAGWGHWRMGEAAQALEAWSHCLDSTRLQPGWAPPTLAMVLWELGRRDEAVAWYAAAVRTEPDLWRDPGNHARLLPGWQPRELQLLAEVHQAWQAAPPAWP